MINVLECGGSSKHFFYSNIKAHCHRPYKYVINKSINVFPQKCPTKVLKSAASFWVFSHYQAEITVSGTFLGLAPVILKD